MRFCVLFMLFLVASCTRLEQPAGALEIQFEQLHGLWFDIAHSANALQEGCENTTILNSATTEDSMSFVYECFRKGWWENYPGVATTSDDYPRLVELHFDDDPNGLFIPTHYWLLAEGDNDSWIAVGEPQEELLWIYARNFRLEANQLADIKEILVERGYFSARYLNRNLAFTSHYQNNPVSDDML